MALSPRQYLNALLHYTCHIHEMFVTDHNQAVDSEALENSVAKEWKIHALRLLQADKATKIKPNDSNERAQLLFLYNHVIAQACEFLLQTKAPIEEEKLSLLVNHINGLGRRIQRHFPESWANVQEIKAHPEKPNAHKQIDEILCLAEFKNLTQYQERVLNNASSRHQFFDRSVKDNKADVLSKLIQSLQDANSVSEIKKTLDSFYADQSQHGGYAVLNTGRGLFTHFTQVKTTTIRLLDKLYEQCKEIEKAQFVKGADI